VAQDSGGDENYRLRRLDLSEPEDPQTGLPVAQELPIRKGARAMVMALPKGKPNEALLQVNERDEKYFDIERLDIGTMQRTPVWENREGCADLVADLDGNLRLATRMTQGGGEEVVEADFKGELAGGDGGIYVSKRRTNAVFGNKCRRWGFILFG
jgi:hypothetical protein